MGGGKHQDSACPRQGWLQGSWRLPKGPPFHQINHDCTNATGHHWARFVEPGLADLPYRPAESSRMAPGCRLPRSTASVLFSKLTRQEYPPPREGVSSQHGDADFEVRGTRRGRPSAQRTSCWEDGHATDLPAEQFAELVSTTLSVIAGSLRTFAKRVSVPSKRFVVVQQLARLTLGFPAGERGIQ